MNKRKIGLGLVIGSVVATLGAAVGIGVANASVPAPKPALTVALPDQPRIVPQPGLTINAGETKTFQIAGQTYSQNGLVVPPGVPPVRAAAAVATTTFPANITGLTITISSIHPTGNGGLTVWTTDAGKPGTTTVAFKTGERNTNITQVAVNSDGKISVYASVKTAFVMGALAYTIPQEQNVPVLKSIAASDKALDQVGGPIRGNGSDLKGATDFGSVTLTKGTWDARVIAGWTGLKNSNKACTSDDNFLTGTLVVVKGATIAADFSNVAATTGGVIIPESNSASLTQDPTATATTFITVTEDTSVHVKLFAYDSDSSTGCTGTLHGNVQSAQFYKVG